MAGVFQLLFSPAADKTLQLKQSQHLPSPAGGVPSPVVFLRTMRLMFRSRLRTSGPGTHRGSTPWRVGHPLRLTESALHEDIKCQSTNSMM